jgi:hypothetical protein
MEIKQDKFGTYYVEGYTRRQFTVFTKDDTCKRGEYLEEIDVMADTVGLARNIARFILDRDYIPGLRIARVVLNW